MYEIPADLKAQLEDRIREQIACEVRGDVSALYEFTLPAIRARRITERDDEPELTYSNIKKFIEIVEEAEILSIEVEEFHPHARRFSDCPVAIVVTHVRYNQSLQPARFRCMWVYSEGTWFTTALGKTVWSTPPDAIH